MIFELGQIKIGTRAVFESGLGVVEEIKSEVEEPAGDGYAIDEEVAFVEVPATRADHQGGGILVELVEAAIGIGEGDRAVDGIAQVDLPADHVVPSGRVGVFEIGHEDFGAAVEGVDGPSCGRWVQ